MECVIYFGRINVTWIVNWLPDWVLPGDRGCEHVNGDGQPESFIVKAINGEWE